MKFLTQDLFNNEFFNIIIFRIIFRILFILFILFIFNLGRGQALLNQLEDLVLDLIAGDFQPLRNRPVGKESCPSLSSSQGCSPTIFNIQLAAHFHSATATLLLPTLFSFSSASFNISHCLLLASSFMSFISRLAKRSYSLLQPSFCYLQEKDRSGQLSAQTLVPEVNIKPQQSSCSPIKSTNLSQKML